MRCVTECKYTATLSKKEFYTWLERVLLEFGEASLPQQILRQYFWEYLSEKGKIGNGETFKPDGEFNWDIRVKHVIIQITN